MSEVRPLEAPGHGSAPEAVLDITPAGVVVREMAESLDFDTLQARTGMPRLR